MEWISIGGQAPKISDSVLVLTESVNPDGTTYLNPAEIAIYGEINGRKCFYNLYDPGDGWGREREILHVKYWAKIPAIPNN